MIYVLINKMDFGAPWKQNSLKRLVHNYNPDVIFIQETMLKIEYVVINLRNC
jgi:hypothetical protein